MDTLPLFLRVRGRGVLLVGGGEIALRKARLLVKAGALVRVVAPRIDAELRKLVEPAGGICVAREFATGDLDDAALVLAVAATDSTEVNTRVSMAASERRLFVNVVDSAELSTAIVPSIVDRSPLIVALGSGGQAPVLLSQWRARLEALLPARLGDLARLAGGFRRVAAERIADPDARRRFWEQVFEGPVADRALAGDTDAAEQALALALDASSPAVGGEVYIVGAGPGAPDLLTLRALQLMQRADVVLHDLLVSEAVLDYARRDARRVAVGTRGRAGGGHQAAINAQMIELARAGQRVLRLKGGDPTLFGRLGEEIDALVDARVPFQIVPGVSAAQGSAAFAGIPLTVRDVAHAVRFVTPRRRGGGADFDWIELAAPGQTLVIYMGGAVLAEICARLIAHGRAADTPLALIENGTLPDARLQIATLATIDVLSPPGDGPVLAIIGEVVHYHARVRQARDQQARGEAAS